MKLETFLLFVVFVNVYFFLTQTGINELNPDDPTTFYHYEGSMIEDFDEGEHTLNEDVTLKLPQSSQAVSADSGGFFTDTFSAIKNWLLDSIGIRYLLNIINAVPNFLKSTQLPHEVAFVLGWLWHTMSLFAFITYLKGG